MIEAYEAGEGTRARIVVMYRVTLRTFGRWWRQYRQGGTFAPAPRGHRSAACQGSDLEALDRATLGLDWHYENSRRERLGKTSPT